MEEGNRHNKTWNDQPDVVLQAPIAFSFYHSPRSVEVRAMEAPDDPVVNSREYFISAGTLFGSQTVRVWGEDKLFEVLRIVLSSAQSAQLPSGVEMLESHKG